MPPGRVHILDQIGPGSTVLTRTVRRVLLRQGFGQIQEPRFARPVIHEARLGLLGEVRPGDHDGTRSARRHFRDQGPAEPDGPHQVRLKRTLPSLIGKIFKHAGIAHAQVVDEHIRRAAERVEHERDRVGHTGGGREIDRDGPAPHRAVRRQRVAILIRDDDGGAFAREQIGDGLSDPLRPGADEHELPRELIIHNPIRLTTSRPGDTLSLSLMKIDNRLSAVQPSEPQGAVT